VDIGEKVTVPDVDFEDIYNTRLITQVVVAVQSLGLTKVMGGDS